MNINMPKYKPFLAPALDAAYAELKAQIMAEVAAVFCVPSHLIGSPAPAREPMTLDQLRSLCGTDGAMASVRFDSEGGFRSN